MDSYGMLRAFADSWGLLAMLIFFCVVVVWVLRPGAKKTHDDAANVIFRNEDEPKDEDRSNGH